MIRWGIIGLGNIALRFTKSILNSQNSQIQAIASHNKDKQKQFKNLLKDVDVYDDYNTLIESDTIDAIYIALPHGMHKEYCIKAMKHHKHVFVEKPSTLSYNDTKELCDLSKQNNVLFMEALKTRFIPFNKRIHQLIDENIIGDITMLSASFNNNLSHVERKPGWYLFDLQQGGATYDVGPYPISFMMDFLGNNYRKIESYKRMQDGIDTYFQASVYYENCKAVIEGAIDENKDRNGYIYGTKGYIVIPMYNRPTEFTIYLNNGGVIHESLALPVDDMFDEICAFEDAYTKHLIEHDLWSHEDMLIQMKIIEQIKKEQ